MKPVLHAPAGRVRGRFAGARPQFGHKAQASAKWLYEKFASSTPAPAPEQTGSVSAKTAVQSDDFQNTLTQADTVPAWRGSAKAQRQADARRAQ